MISMSSIIGNIKQPLIAAIHLGRSHRKDRHHHIPGTECKERGKQYNNKSFSSDLHEAYRSREVIHPECYENKHHEVMAVELMIISHNKACSQHHQSF